MVFRNIILKINLVFIYLTFIEPVELDFFSESKKCSMRKTFSFNFKFEEFFSKTDFKVLRCDIIRHNLQSEIRYHRQFGHYYVLLEI